MTYRAVAFDFDLTLADSSAAFHECYGFAAGALGLPLASREEAGRMIGTPLHLAFEHLYGAQHAALASDFLRLWQTHADAVMNDLTVLLPGAADAVRRLHAAGRRLAIVSQKRRYRLEAVLEREGLLVCFDAVFGEEDVPAFKPDPRGLLLALGRLGAGLDESLYVGDTTIDAETATNAGVPFVAVLTGFSPREDFATYLPVVTLPSVKDLPSFLGLADA